MNKLGTRNDKLLNHTIRRTEIEFARHEVGQVTITYNDELGAMSIRKNDEEEQVAFIQMNSQRVLYPAVMFQGPYGKGQRVIIN